MQVVFKGKPFVAGGFIDPPSQELIKNTLGLWNASPEDAVKYGGDLTRAALGAVKLHNDRKHVVVDTKIHMLMPGMIPSIPGWHTDGIPRGKSGSPQERAEPCILDQIDTD